MGLTNKSLGIGLLKNGADIHKSEKTNKVIALAGNPNVGKSTLFNRLTGMNQHTGNWAGKTVSNAQGCYKGKDKNFILVDIPGTYSLNAHSAEEQTARNFICFGNTDAVAVVCDATCLERNLNLVLQIGEVTNNVIVCVNLLDEAERRGIDIDLKLLSDRLGMPVVGTASRNRRGADPFKAVLESFNYQGNSYSKIEYPKEIEMAVALLEPAVKALAGDKINSRWLSLRLISGDNDIVKEAEEYLDIPLLTDAELSNSLNSALKGLNDAGFTNERITDKVASSVVNAAHKIMSGVVKSQRGNSDTRSEKIDKIFTGRFSAFPIMLLLLAVVFWITVVGANYPSSLLSELFSKLGKYLSDGIQYLGAPEWLHGILIDGAYKVLSWVVAVMLPPMAIFFPFFTVLEDSGYLPRIAYNLDRPFKKCSACGKQALTMCKQKYRVSKTTTAVLQFLLVV